MYSSNYQWFETILYALLPQIPLYLIYLIGIVVAVIYLKRYPRVSFLTIASICLSFLSGIALTAIQVLLPSYLIRQGNSTQAIGYYFFGLGFISNLIHVIAFGLLLIATFSGRSNSAQKQFE